MTQKQTSLVTDPIEHLHFLSEQRLFAASSPRVCFHLCVPLLLPIDQMLSVGGLQIQAMPEIITMIKTVMLMSISSLDLGRAPGTGFKMMCSAVPCAAFLYLLILRANPPCLNLQFFFVFLKTKKNLENASCTLENHRQLSWLPPSIMLTLNTLTSAFSTQFSQHLLRLSVSSPLCTLLHL